MNDYQHILDIANKFAYQLRKHKYFGLVSRFKIEQAWKKALSELEKANIPEIDSPDWKKAIKLFSHLKQIGFDICTIKAVGIVQVVIKDKLISYPAIYIRAKPTIYLEKYHF